MTSIIKWEEKNIEYSTDNDNIRRNNITLNTLQLLEQPKLLIQIQSQKNRKNFIIGQANLITMRKKKPVKEKRLLLDQTG